MAKGEQIEPLRNKRYEIAASVWRENYPDRLVSIGTNNKYYLLACHSVIWLALETKHLASQRNL